MQWVLFQGMELERFQFCTPSQKGANSFLEELTYLGRTSSTREAIGSHKIVCFCKKGRKNMDVKPYTLRRVATVREKYLENEFFSRSGKSQGIL